MSEVMNVPEGWEEQQISQVAEVVGGGTPKRDNDENWKNGTIYWATPTDITAIKDSNFILNTKEKITKYGLLNSSSKLLPKDSILLTSRATIGTRKINKVPMCTNQGFTSLIPKEDNTLYLYYMLDMYKRQMYSRANGTTFPEISRTEVKNIKVVLPKLEKEQKKIAKILSTLDQTIEATQKLIAKERNIKKGLMHDLLTNGIDENGKIRSPQTHKYKESELGLIPEGWEVVSFKDANIELIDGDRGTNYPKSSDFLDYGYCLFLSAKNVTKKGFSFKENQFITKKKDDELRKGKLQKQDIVLTTRGTVGNLAYYTDDINYSNIRINSGMIILRNKNSKINTDFLYLLLRSSIFESQVLLTVFGSAQPQLTVKEMEKFLVVYPKAEKEQKQITNILIRQDKKIETEEKNLAKLKALKKGLMNDLLSGKVRV